MVRAFRELLGAVDGDLLIPDYNTSMGAIGAIMDHMNREEKSSSGFSGTGELEKYIHGEKSRGKSFEPLITSDAEIDKSVYAIPSSEEKYEVYLGLDIGSLSTNVVLIDDQNRVIARRYLPTASKG